MNEKNSNRKVRNLLLKWSPKVRKIKKSVKNRKVYHSASQTFSGGDAFLNKIVFATPNS
jgi:hypothetical protein